MHMHTVSFDDYFTFALYLFMGLFLQNADIFSSLDLT